jgi:hypothetical protein
MVLRKVSCLGETEELGEEVLLEVGPREEHHCHLAHLPGFTNILLILATDIMNLNFYIMKNKKGLQKIKKNN